jgi:threonine/homoserine/homoserine lactone efflux protein
MTSQYYKAMNVLDFGVEVMAVSASGVLAPGPLFFTNLLYGTRLGMRSGIKVAYGHTVVELPLITLLAAGLFTLDAATKYAGTIGFIGGIAILAFAGLQTGSIIRKKPAYITSAPDIAGSKGPFIVGIVFSGLNPFFLIWWFTAGLKLIADSAAFGFGTGLAILFALHIWMDYAWLGGTAYLASKGSMVIKSKYYSLLVLALVAMLVYYGISFVFQSVPR